MSCHAQDVADSDFWTVVADSVEDGCRSRRILKGQDGGALIDRDLVQDDRRAERESTVRRILMHKAMTQGGDVRNRVGEHRGAGEEDQE